MEKAMSNETIEDISLIMGASDPMLLFGTNEKRARIRYRRLMKSVHPDMNGDAPEAKEATKRLNALWESYERMTSTEGATTAAEEDQVADTSHFVHEIARTERFVLFSEGGHWMVVDRQADAPPMPTADEDARKEFARMMQGTPVTVLNGLGEKSVRQADGYHHAVTFGVPPFFAPEHRILSLADIKHHVPGGIMEPEDVAWVLKRCLFAVAGLAKAGLRPERGLDFADMVVLDVDAHVLIVMAPDRLIGGTGGVEEQREAIGRMARTLSEMIDASDHRNRGNRQMRAFLRGVMVDHVTETSVLLGELNDLLLDLFGKPRFHKMRLVG